MAEARVSEDHLRKIKAIVFDVDGVLTDGGMWWGAGGEELKRFSFSDIMGISLARRSGLVLALISGENSPLVDRYAAKMKIPYVVKGCRDKGLALRVFAEQNELQLAEICFMGDDVNDLPAMEVAGMSAAPCDARGAVLAVVDFIAIRPGGNGAVRELVEALLTARGTTAAKVYRDAMHAETAP